MIFKMRARAVKGKIPEGESLIFERLKVDGERFADRRLLQLCSIGSTFWNCRFESLTALNIGFGDGMEYSTYENCVFDRIKSPHVGVGLAHFINCQFVDIDFNKFWGCVGDIIGCKFSGTLRDGFIQAQRDPLTISTYKRKGVNRIEGNDFSDVHFINFDFKGGVDLTRQALPTGPEYVYVKDGAAALAKLAFQASQELLSEEVRTSVLRTVKVFQESVERGQAQIFAREDDFGHMHHEPRRYFFDHLRQAAATQ